VLCVCNVLNTAVPWSHAELPIWPRTAKNRGYAFFQCNGAPEHWCKIFKSLWNSDCLIWEDVSEQLSKQPFQYKLCRHETSWHQNLPLPRTIQGLNISSGTEAVQL